MVKEFLKGITTLSKCFNHDITPISRVWLRIYQQRLQNRGKVDAVKFMKELNTVVERYALHQAIEPIPWTKSDCDNFPMILSMVKPYLRSKDNLTVLFTISVFRAVESLRLPISKDISTIIDPCQADDLIVNDIINFIPSWLKWLPPLKLPKLKYHLTVKNGPNGPALMESDSDIAAVINTPSIYEAIRTSEREQSDTDPMEVDDLYVNKENPIHSKLTQFPEKAGKTRTIAIIDYYSQRCLHPLHKGLMHFLANLISDGTYSHTNVGKFAAKATKEKSFIACADLSAATDRFPAIIQYHLILGLIPNSDLAESLWTLLAKRTFTVSWSGEEVVYQCGQPMGAHASWPLFAIAHHLVVEYSGYKAGVKDVKLKYKLIGDDVIITDEKLWLKYKDTMLALGLTLNLGKTVQSPEHAKFSSAEVAKQLYLNGINLTPLTPGFIANLKKPHMFNTCLEILQERYGESVCPIPSPMLIDTFYLKAKTKRLVWLLASNPVSGYIKPTDVGYNEYSPWVPIPIGDFLNEYKSALAEMVVGQATREVAQCMGWLNISLVNLYGGVPPDAQECPWEDMTHPQPKSLKRAFKACLYDLTASLNAIKISFFNGDIESVLDEVSYVPRPGTPYLERTELRNKRTSSIWIKLYNMIEM